MTATDSRLELPTVTIDIRGTQVYVDVGELLFPMLVLLFCGAYYVDTRALPEDSMLYARPLLYVTVGLAVLTVFGQAVSVSRERSESAGDKSGIVGVLHGVGSLDHDDRDRVPRSGTPESKQESKSRFNVVSAGGLVILSAIYILSLYVAPFVVSTTGFLAVSLYLFGERDLTVIIVYSVGFTLLLWIVFIEWLLVPLP